MTAPAAQVESVLRECAPRVLGALVRRYGDFDACEDALQEALLAAAQQWPREGVPASPHGWLTTVASRRHTELWRNEAARKRREGTVFLQEETLQSDTTSDVDDTLTLLFLCCHPSLTAPSQVALTLRAVGGLTTAEIARAFLVPEATIAQRISRAKARIRATGAEFSLPPEAERTERLAAVLHVLYLIFNEGYTASSGADLQRVELSGEAIRLARQLRQRLAGDGEVTGLLALMLLTDARRPARTLRDGSLVPLAEQDRALWDSAAIIEGIALISEVLPRARLGPYQVQAAIAAVHDEATRAEDTDWPQILGLYDVLRAIAPGPMVTLNRAVAVAMVHGAPAALRELDAAEVELGDHHRLHAVRAHLLELTGNAEAARREYEVAARSTLSLPEQRYLERRALRLRDLP